jgi:hypothetical protein
MLCVRLLIQVVTVGDYPDPAESNDRFPPTYTLYVIIGQSPPNGAGDGRTRTSPQHCSSRRRPVESVQGR